MSQSHMRKGDDEKINENRFVHPKSRKCVAMVKKMKKESKRDRAKSENKIKQSMVAEKLLWFQKNMDFSICPYTKELTADLVERYISRNDEELAQIKIKQSIGANRQNQHIGRENAIRMTKEREISDYGTCGLEIPNILICEQYKLLQKWTGDIKVLPNFKLIRFKRSTS